MHISLHAHTCTYPHEHTHARICRHTGHHTPTTMHQTPTTADQARMAPGRSHITPMCANLCMHMHTSYNNPRPAPYNDQMAAYTISHACAPLTTTHQHADMQLYTGSPHLSRRSTPDAQHCSPSTHHALHITHCTPTRHTA